MISGNDVSLPERISRLLRCRLGSNTYSPLIKVYLNTLQLVKTLHAAFRLVHTIRKLVNNVSFVMR